MSKATRICVFCGKQSGGTNDHLPPKCFFPTPCPPIQLITVPCCEGCRVREASNDALIRSLLISTIQAEPHPAVQTQLADSRNRSFARSRKDFEKVARTLVNKGPFPTFNFNIPEMDAFLLRLARGLLHEETGIGFVRSKIEWRLDPLDFPAHFGPHTKTRAVGNIFAYSVVFHAGGFDSVWLLTFYEKLRFGVHLMRES